jgi:hypothetical protein
MMKRVIPATLVFSIAQVAVPQSLMKMPKIKDAGFPGVTITAYEAVSLEPELDPLMRLGPVAIRMRAFSQVITNATERPIVGIAVRWTWRDQAGKQQIYNLRSDGLFLVRSDVVPPGGRILVTPDIVFPIKRPTQTGYISPSMGPGKWLDRFEQENEDLAVALDAIVFADGEVAGPDESRMMQYIMARNAAAQTLARSVLAIIQQGKDPAAFLSATRSQNAGSTGDYMRLWNYRLADSLFTAQHKTEYAEQLLALAMPVLFRR